MPTVNKEKYTLGEIEITDPQKRTNGELTTTLRCKVKYRGSSSLQYEKKSFAVKIINGNDSAIDVSVLGIRNSDNWILNAMAIDRIRMRDRVLFDIWNEMSPTPYETDFGKRNGTKGYFVELFLNGDYHGLYCLTDKIDRKLLNLKKVKEEDGNMTVRGLLLKCNSWCDAAFLRNYKDEDMAQEEWNSWELQYPDNFPSTATYAPLAKLIDFCNDSSNEEFLTSIEDHFYLQNIIDYHLFIVAFGINDNTLKNTFLSARYLTKSQQFLITPWDLDTSLGGWYEGSHYEDLTSYNLWSQPFNRLLSLSDAHYLNKLKSRWQTLRTSILSEESIAKRLDGYANNMVTSGAWERECIRWNNNPVALTTDPQEELRYVKEWYGRSFSALDKLLKDDSSVIQSILVPYSTTTSYRYNLYGQRVNKDYKGLIIENHHKIIIR